MPNLDIEKYLKNIYYQKNNIKVIGLENNVFLELIDYQGFVTNSTVSIEGENVSDGVFKNATYPKKYVIQNSKILKILVEELYKTDKGDLLVEIRQGSDALPGDSVYLNNLPAPDGKYKRGFLDFLYVKDAKITTKKILMNNLKY